MKKAIGITRQKLDRFDHRQTSLSRLLKLLRKLHLQNTNRITWDMADEYCWKAEDHSGNRT